MALRDFGYNKELEKARLENSFDDIEIGRVISEQRERYIVVTNKGELEAEITGNLRFSAKSNENFPVVGDWVALKIYDSDFCLIHKIFPRISVISRKAVGHFGDIQLIAANIDFALVIQAVDRDFNINRLERYLTVCHSSKVNPIILLTKIDLMSKQQSKEIFKSLRQRIKDIPIIAISNKTRHGYEELKKIFVKGKTYCMLGSSGVGKSTMINNLSGTAMMRTGPISQSTNKGKHVTSHRELVLMPDGSLIIDNPGMREVGIADTTIGLETTFEKIISYSQNCKFKNCSHTVEVGCSVLAAVRGGDIDKELYENYLKMKKEKAFFDSSITERRKKDRDFGRMVKYYKKTMGKNRH